MGSAHAFEKRRGELMSSKPIAAYRELFPGLKKHAYFMTNSLGAMPSTVGPALQEMMQTWSDHGANAWEKMGS